MTDSLPRSDLLTCQQVVSNDPTRCLASHHGAPSSMLPERGWRGAEQGDGGLRELVWMAWRLASNLSGGTCSRPVERRAMSFRLSFHQPVLGPTGADQLDNRL